ncbi:GNAT family N-acetyltransferase [Pseudomonas sp. NCCP-436]|uniref:GNAT family N-acetyltransferase n=1 Tax=Pseudomonas sp. NCCP-436 TaxID=2842481 RepID=UPI001C80F3E2|nr:GNAT family N-acetyltransferase [Pseudomonas sp. NCCP-436]GIZ11122.1 GNAT family N-acetyltransferase [Pseudomonas sp. NCCP-436]
MSDICIRSAQSADIPSLCELIFEHGPNPWNYLPEAEVRQHLQAIDGGSTRAVLAEDDSGLLGFVSFRTSRDFAAHQPAERREALHGYICEAVVRHDCAGRGLGSRLLEAAVGQLRKDGLQDIYIDRHEENAASAGMMRKAGFVELLSYEDLQRRTWGSRRSTLCCRRFEG